MERQPAVESAVIGVRFQFHATSEELIDLALSWRDTHSLHLAGEQFFPDWNSFELEGDGPRERLDRVDRLALRRRSFDLTVTTASAFAQSNPGSLYIHVQKVIRHELGEASIGGHTSDPAEADLWRGLIRQVRSRSHKGASVKNWAAVVKAPSHRHSPGAHRMAERGVRMVAFPGGGTEYLFDDLT